MGKLEDFEIDNFVQITDGQFTGALGRVDSLTSIYVIVEIDKDSIPPADAEYYFNNKKPLFLANPANLCHV